MRIAVKLLDLIKFYAKLLAMFYLILIKLFIEF